MFKKIRDFLAPMLLHPAATAFTVITGLVSGLEAIGAQLQQIGWQLGPVAYYIPHSMNVVVGMTITASVCTLLAGMGRSFISFVDAQQKKDQVKP